MCYEKNVENQMNFGKALELLKNMTPVKTMPFQ